MQRQSPASGPRQGLAARVGRRRAVLAGTAIVVLAASGCQLPFTSASPSSSITATADFSDVSNLVTGAPVELADITIGHVDSINLAGTEAKVVMSIERSAQVPADVTAEVTQATILGEEVVELVPPTAGRSGASTATRQSGGAAGAGLLADGATIRRTEVVPGIEQVVQAGTAVIGSIGTSQLATMIQAGGEGFGGEGPTLKRLLGDLDNVSGAYASRDREITSLVGELHELGSSLAPDAASNAEAIGNLARATGVLATQSGRFVQLMGALDQLAVQGRGILENYLPGLDLQLEGLDHVTSALAARQQDLGLLLQYLPGHDATLHDLTVGDFAQVVNDLIVCGLPGGGSSPQAASTCGPGSGGPSVGGTGGK